MYTGCTHLQANIILYILEYTPGHLFPPWLCRFGVKTVFINLHNRQVYWWLSKRWQRVRRACCRCDEGRLCCQAWPLLHLPSFMVLLETWWPYPLPCKKKWKLGVGLEERKMPRPNEKTLIHAMVPRPQPALVWDPVFITYMYVA